MWRRSGFGGGANHGFQICGRIGDARQNGRAAHADAQSGFAKLRDGFDAQIRTRSARLQNPRQIDIQRGDL